MLVHRSARRTIEPARVLASVEEAIAGAFLDAPDVRDRWTSVLIEAGALEAAVVDQWSPDRDRWDARHAVLRAFLDRLGAAAVASWADQPIELTGLADALTGMTTLDLPPSVNAEVPEGFAYHGIYPDTYVDAAQQCAAELQPSHVVVIGVRSIGTSLSAVVGASLRRRGIAVRSYTVRPRGDSMTVLLDESLTRELLHGGGPDDPPGGTLYAIVDEGPAITGSSFAAVSRALDTLGVCPERMVLFPAWEPEPTIETSRERWTLHRRYVGSFDDLYLRGGRLASAFGGGVLTELSAGRWRDVFCPSSGHAVAVHPKHEQRKYLLARDNERLVLKFVGLGAHGTPRLTLAESLSRPGLSPQPLSLRAGVLAYGLQSGRPMTCRDLTAGFLEHAAGYLAHRAIAERGVSDVTGDDLVAMIAENARQTLGDAASAQALLAVERWRARLGETAPVRVDGRLMPHEWICTETGWMKADALSHHDDQFLPGCQDIAWDVAGMIDEWELGPAEQRAFLDDFIAKSGDDRIEARLPIWRVAYLAFRAGYTKLAAGALGNDADGHRMIAMHQRYAARLASSLEALAAIAP